MPPAMVRSIRTIRTIRDTVCLLLVCGACGAAPAVHTGAPAAPVGLEQLVRVVGGLVFVLVAIAAAAFVGRRLKGLRVAGGSRMRIVDSVSVGVRDRIVLLEVDRDRILLGLTPGRIRRLHVFAARERGFEHELADAVHRTGSEGPA